MERNRINGKLQKMDNCPKKPNKKLLQHPKCLYSHYYHLISFKQKSCINIHPYADKYLIVWRQFHGCHRVDVFLHFVEKIIPAPD
jgi:hypothetical protein